MAITARTKIEGTVMVGAVGLAFWFGSTYATKREVQAEASSVRAEIKAVDDKVTENRKLTDDFMWSFGQTLQSVCERMSKTAADRTECKIQRVR